MTAAAQNQQNTQASQASNISGNVNARNPYGSVNYDTGTMTPTYDSSGNVTGYAPRYTQVTSLAPDQQNLLDLETRAKTNLGNTAVSETANLQNALNKPVDPSQWTPWQTSLLSRMRQDAGVTDRAGIEDAMMKSYNHNVAPAEQAQEASLAARGLSPGSQGYAQMQATRRRQSRRGCAPFHLSSAARASGASRFNDVGTQRFNMNQAANSYLNNLRGAQMQEAYRPHPADQRNHLADVGRAGHGAAIPAFQARRSRPRISASTSRTITGTSLRRPRR
jgi:hypothetical protein